MKIHPSNLLVAATTVLTASATFPSPPAQALTWTLNDGIIVGTDPTDSITGSFTIDHENGTSPSVTFSDLMIDGLTFTEAEVDFISLATPIGSGIGAIDWFDGLNSLSLVFNSPLTTAGGTIFLHDFVSDFNGSAVSGSVVGGSKPPATQEPSTILGLATALGFCAFSTVKKLN